jgi:cytochrome c-type biogenesis protein CcmH/NrfG
VPQAAQPLLEAAVSVDPDDLSAAALLAMTYLALGSAEEAREVLSGLERRGAPDEMILPLLAQAHRETRDFGKALEAARRWISLDPGNSDAFRELSQTLLLQGNFDEAHEALARAIELEARN